ncbi:hypothetical protein PR202_ga09725 [Eleusine coracana subsp. coracana]|uniref:Transferrin receptor-like dimerisation domain-containing protein n=1 Tax=Eleusine coracana subsp. coracana TaxID=191504 RepID=A0AAV5C5J3_ELECO|nr:hypothetical protein PR202_ga09725 [Eleusine coracana subsp. coracana]
MWGPRICSSSRHPNTIPSAPPRWISDSMAGAREDGSGGGRWRESAKETGGDAGGVDLGAEGVGGEGGAVDLDTRAVEAELDMDGAGGEGGGVDLDVEGIGGEGGSVDLGASAVEAERASGGGRRRGRQRAGGWRRPGDVARGRRRPGVSARGEEEARQRRSAGEAGMSRGEREADVRPCVATGGERYVILGNHRDAWTFGAADPNSGTASMIEHCFIQTGSTEWVEENRDILSSRAVAYLNIDCSVVGPVFRPSASPQLDELFQETIKLVQDPDNSSQTVYDSWVKSNISPMVSFPTLANYVDPFNSVLVLVAFYQGPGYPVYHSLYDDYLWMAKFGDPGFRRHVAAASIWGMMALRLANEEILPFNYMSYVGELEELQRKLLSKKLNKDSLKIRELNDRLMQAERAFTSREGLVSDKWSKHLVFGDSEQNDWDTAAYPGIADAIAKARRSNTSESWKMVQHEIYRVARAVTQAATVLSGSLT